MQACIDKESIAIHQHCQESTLDAPKELGSLCSSDEIDYTELLPYVLENLRLLLDRMSVYLYLAMAGDSKACSNGIFRFI